MASWILRRSFNGAANFKVDHVKALSPTRLQRNHRLNVRSMASGGSQGAHNRSRSAVLKLGLTAMVLMSTTPPSNAGQVKNVLGGELEMCCSDPLTGFNRDGFCRVTPGDYGVHAVCAEVTQEFLDFSASRGNDLSSVVKAGQRWCLCVSRWKEAFDAGKAPPVVLASTSEDALKKISLEDLKAHAWSGTSKQ